MFVCGVLLLSPAIRRSSACPQLKPLSVGGMEEQRCRSVRPNTAGLRNFFAHLKTAARRLHPVRDPGRAAGRPRCDLGQRPSPQASMPSSCQRHPGSSSGLDPGSEKFRRLRRSSRRSCRRLRPSHRPVPRRRGPPDRVSTRRARWASPIGYGRTFRELSPCAATPSERDRTAAGPARPVRARNSAMITSSQDGQRATTPAADPYPAAPRPRFGCPHPLSRGWPWSVTAKTFRHISPMHCRRILFMTCLPKSLGPESSAGSWPSATGNVGGRLAESCRPHTKQSGSNDVPAMVFMGARRLPLRGLASPAGSPWCNIADVEAGIARPGGHSAAIDRRRAHSMRRRAGNGVRGRRGAAASALIIEIIAPHRASSTNRTAARVAHTNSATGPRISIGARPQLVPARYDDTSPSSIRWMVTRPCRRRSRHDAHRVASLGACSRPAR